MPLKKQEGIPVDFNKQKKYRVVIHPQEGIMGKDDVVLGINGNHLQVKRGYEVILPESYLNVLKDSKITHIGKNDDGTEDIREILRFSFEVRGEVQEEEANDS